MNTQYSERSGSYVVELTATTVSLLVLTRIVFMLRSVSFIDSILPVIVAVLFLYIPVIVLWKRKRRIDFLDLKVKGYIRSIFIFLIAAVIVFPLFFLAAHAWQLIVFNKTAFTAAGFPDLLSAIAFQLIIVALPEEFYFRGYFQTTMDRVLPKRWKILGVKLGWGWIITAAVFAVAHTIVYYQWWHFAIFFPALLFGYLKERTGTITTPILFHAASNLLMNWFARSYI